MNEHNITYPAHAETLRLMTILMPLIREPLAGYTEDQKIAYDRLNARIEKYS